MLTDIYGAKPEEIDVKAEKLRASRCHRRIKPGHDRGRAILTRSIGFKQDAEKTCKLKSHTGETRDANDADDDDTDPAPAAPGIDVDARYLAPMAGRTRSGVRRAGPNAHVIFIATPTYVQCLHDSEGKRMYCEGGVGGRGRQIARAHPDAGAHGEADRRRLRAARPDHELQPVLPRSGV